MHDRIALAARIRHHIASVFVDLEETLYAKTGNPMHAWQALHYAHRGNLVPPAWVLSYLAAAAGPMTERGARAPRGIAEALGLGVRGGPSRQAQAVTTRRDLMIADDIARTRRSRCGQPEQHLPSDLLSVQDDVSERHRLSQEQCQRIWRAFEDLTAE